MDDRDKPGGQEAPGDVLFVHSPCAAGEGFRVLRTREGSLEVGELRALKQGRPIVGEVVKLTQREEHERLFDIEVVASTTPAPSKRSGPAQVATEAYLTNWETIFGGTHGDPGSEN